MKPVVLIVDDSESSRYLLAFLLGKAGLQAMLAADGRSAIEMAARRPPDLVLLDLQMPELDGFETAGRLRALPGLRAVPIVAVTANATTEARAQVGDAGFAGYFSKPIDTETFPAAIRHYLNLPPP